MSDPGGGAGRVTLVMRTESAPATEALGADLARLLRPGDVVLLTGELGAGKTTLVRGAVEALGGGEAVTSPTFTLCHLYRTEPPVAHVDCWRMERLAELVDLGLEEVLDEGAVALIEWGEAAAPLYGEGALTVSLAPEAGSGDAREVRLAASGPGWSRRLSELAERWRREGREVRRAEG